MAGEVEAALADCFPQALIGVSAQGWLREIGPDSRVRPVPAERWQGDPLLRQAHVLFVSDEDLPPNSKPVLEKWSRRVDTLAYTSGEHGAEVCHRGAWRRIDPFPAKSVDPTGAGDIFAAAVLVRYQESGDTLQATRFAAGAAALIVESEGLADIPDRATIEERLQEHPEIVPR